MKSSKIILFFDQLNQHPLFTVNRNIQRISAGLQIAASFHNKIAGACIGF